MLLPVSVSVPKLTTPLAVTLLAVTLPVSSPTSEVAVTVVKLILASKLTVAVLPVTTEVRLVPPTIDSVSVSKLMVSVPLSPAMFSTVARLAVPAAVKRPLESTVKVGIWVALP